MADHTVEQFDFDDWAGLYIENPQEFEARRKAALMIQLTRGSAEHCESGRKLIESFDKQAGCCNSQQRMELAANMMAESLAQLGTELQMLKLELENCVGPDKS